MVKKQRDKEKLDYRFYNYLYALRMMERQSKGTVTSDEVQRATGILSPTVRKDFSVHLSAVGIRGKGYKVVDLIKDIEGILGIDQKWDIVLVGVGKIGTSILANKKIRQAGYNIKYAFDSSMSKIGSIIQSTPVKNVRYLKRIVEEEKVKIAIIAATEDYSQKLVDILVEAGVEGILNMSGGQVRVPESVMCIELDLSFYLTELSHFITQKHSNKVLAPGDFSDVCDDFEHLDEEFERGVIGGN